ncbi:MAG: 1-deoxy-D-xylulose-5-phosphate synthase N-terminal domain-containing protein, partial [Catonella sp.]
MPLTDKIKEPNDIKKIPESELKELAVEIRRMLIKSTAANGGHLASNLGVVELTFALHRYLNFPEDKLIWDVGHQSYVHKILTGRKERLENLRKLDGLSGFPKKNESECDAFGTGHASTSISAALGMVVARDLHGTKEKIVAVIGDGAMTGGMALEALNNAGTLKSNLIIILNDNERSISKNVGGVARYLDGIRT